MDAIPSKMSASERGSAREPAVVGLAEVDAGWIGLVGGKAAGLGELVGAGERVPEGFCITTAAQEAVRAASGVVADDRRELRRRSVPGTAALRRDGP